MFGVAENFTLIASTSLYGEFTRIGYAALLTVIGNFCFVMMTIVHYDDYDDRTEF